MKTKLFGWMTFVMMAFVCVGFAACSSDDDDNNGGGSGKSSSSGVSVKTGYGYFIKNSSGTIWEFHFCSHNMAAIPSSNAVIDLVTIDLKNEAGSTDIPVGEFSGCFAVDILKGANAGRDNGTIYESGRRSETTGKLTISKSGNNYTVSYSGVNLYQVDEATDQRVGNAIVSSFSYTGPIIDYPDVDWDGDDK